MFGNYTIVIFIGAGVFLIIIVAAITTMFIIRGKKKKNSTSSETSVPMGYDSYTGSEKTESVDHSIPTDSQYTIKISHVSNPSKAWTLVVVKDLIIGRSDRCQIRLDDKSVSREHCKITVQGIGIAIVHVGSTNKTFLNGSNVPHTSPLQSGDIIKIGRESLRVDYIQALGNQAPKPEYQRSTSDRKTESIF